MAGYTHARLTDEVMREHGVGTAWEDQLTGQPQWYVVGPDGRPADWPLLDDEAEARGDAADFDRPDEDYAELAHGEAVWQARMAGDMEAF